MSASALAPPRATAVRIASLIRSQVSASPSATSPLPSGSARRRSRDGRPHAGFGGGLRPADSSQLGVALDAAAPGEGLVVGPHLDARLPQPVGELERERRGDDRVLDPERLARVHRHPEARPPRVEAPVRAARPSRTPRRRGLGPPGIACARESSSEPTTTCRVPLRSTYRNGSPIEIGTSWRISGERVVSA